MFKLALDRGINEDPLFKIGKQNDFKIGASGAARAAAAARPPLFCGARPFRPTRGAEGEKFFGRGGRSKQMLKGVSQKVIEVVHTDNRYFEKAILFLRPNAQGEDKLSLRARAGEYLSQIDYNPAGHEKCKTPLGEALKIGLAALVGAAVACAFFLL